VHRAPGIPHALCFQGGRFWQTSDASRREIAVVCLAFAVIASEAKQSTLSFLLYYGLLRFARNDGLTIICALDV
jgi:hypothetical protein